MCWSHPESPYQVNVCCQTVMVHTVCKAHNTTSTCDHVFGHRPFGSLLSWQTMPLHTKLSIVRHLLIKHWSSSTSVFLYLHHKRKARSYEVLSRSVHSEATMHWSTFQSMHSHKHTQGENLRSNWPPHDTILFNIHVWWVLMSSWHYTHPPCTKLNTWIIKTTQGE